MGSSLLPVPFAKAIIYEDDLLYACLANFPLCEGHCVVVWKDDVIDLHLLSRPDFEYLMDFVDLLRNALLKTLGVEKVYLLYMDEANHVHWHLIPRFNEKGFNCLMHEPGELKDYSLAEKIKKKLKI